MLLKQEALEELFEERYVSIAMKIEQKNLEREKTLEQNSFIKLVEAYSNNKEDLGLQAIVLSLYNFAMSSTDPTKWLLEAAEDFNIKEGYNFSDTPWAAVLMEDIKIELLGIEKVMIKALKIIEGNEAIELV